MRQYGKERSGLANATLVDHAGITRKIEAVALPTGGRCAACDDELPHKAPVRGIVSGEELGLCGTCAMWVNNPASAERFHRKVLANAAKRGNDANSD